MTPVGLLFKVNSEGLFTCPVNASPVDYAKSTKAEPMTKDEAMLLVQLVAASHTVIINKTTNATNNRMKDQAWQTIAVDFNSSVSSSRRTAAQLRLKWDNLKKAARKRCADMRISHNKTGGGKDNFPPDEVLDKVASLLRNTFQGFSMDFGGDATENLVTDEVDNIEVTALGDGSICGGVDEREVLKETKQNNKPKFNKETESNNTNKQIFDKPPPTKQKKFFLTKASRSGLLAKRKLRMEEKKYKACISRENALAEYLIAKKRNIELENEEKEINIAKLKLELENSKLENVKLEKVLNLID